MVGAENGALDVLLFETDGEELLDIKCFRGDRANVTGEEIEQQIHSALMQLKMHPDISSPNAPNVGVKTVDMVELVKALPVAA